MVLLLFTLAFSSCRKSADLRWDTDILVPLMHSSLDVWDIIGDTNVVENPDQSMSIVVDEKVELLDPDKVIEVYDTLAEDIFNIPLYLQYAPGDQLTKTESSVTMDLDDMELTYARARVASMKFYVTNSIQQPLRVKYELLSSDKNGKPFEVIENVPAATSSGPSYSVKTIHLDGFNMDMTGDGTQVNTVISRTTVWLHPDADTIWITPDDTVLIISTFDEMKIDYARGYFGQKTYLGNGSTALNVFGNFKAGSFDLDRANAQLIISNYAGMDVQMQLNKLSTFNNKTNQEVLLNDPIIGDLLNITRAQESGPSIDDINPMVKKYQIVNSNLDEMIELMPDSMLFDISAQINPLGNVSSGNDFLYFQKAVEATISLEIPLKLSINGLRIEDYSTMNFEDNEKLKSGVLVVYAENSFPMDLDIQFYILDENENIVDSFFTEKSHIVSAIVDAQGYVVKASENRLSIPLDEHKIQVLRKYSDVLIRAEVNTAGHRSFQLYQNHKLDIRIVGDVKYEL